MRLIVAALSLITRTFGSFRGRWRLMRWLMRQDALLESFKPTLVRSRSGVSLIVHPNEFIGRHLYVQGEYEGQLEEYFMRIIRTGDCVLDVGANLGYFTLLAAGLVGPQGRVHAFEPDPLNYERLQANVALNRLQDRVHMYPAAVTDCDDHIAFWMSGMRNRGTSAGRLLSEPDAQEIVVRSVRLDSLLGTLGPVKLLKLDVEGAEHKALHGMVGLLERDNPTIIYECSDAFLRLFGSSSEALARFLRGRGYGIYEFGSGGLIQMLSCPSEQCNLVAIHERQIELLEKDVFA